MKQSLMNAINSLLHKLNWNRREIVDKYISIVYVRRFDTAPDRRHQIRKQAAKSRAETTPVNEYIRVRPLSCVVSKCERSSNPLLDCRWCGSERVVRNPRQSRVVTVRARRTALRGALKEHTLVYTNTRKNRRERPGTGTDIPTFSGL